jgi:hypothetical protein
LNGSSSRFSSNRKVRSTQNHLGGFVSLFPLPRSGKEDDSKATPTSIMAPLLFRRELSLDGSMAVQR